MKYASVYSLLTLLCLATTLSACQDTTGLAGSRVRSETTDTIARNPAPPEGYRVGALVDDLEDRNRFNEFGGTWFTYSDRAEGGDSRVVPSRVFQPRSGGVGESRLIAQITGEVTDTYPDGYIGIGMDLNNSNQNPRDLTQYDAISFWAKGDGKPYRFKIYSAKTPDYDDYGYNFTPTQQWKHFVIDFSELEQEGWGTPVDRQTALRKALKIQWQTIGQPHNSVRLAVDNIYLLVKTGE